MLGGYNVKPLIDLLDDAEVAAVAADGAEEDPADVRLLPRRRGEGRQAGNAHAKAVMQSWADAEWFTSRPEVPQSITVTVFKVTGETNTDDLSPAPDAWTPPGHPAARAGDAEERPPRHRARRRRQARPDQVHRGR